MNTLTTAAIEVCRTAAPRRASVAARLRLGIGLGLATWGAVLLATGQLGLATLLH